METALILCIPEAQPAIGSWRERYDPSATEGVPPHVTVLIPFKPAADITPGVAADLAHTFRNYPSFRLQFSRTGRFDNCLWLAPEPADRVSELTLAIAERFPECSPYGGVFQDIIPHLTIAMGTGGELDAIEHDVLPALCDPIESEVRYCSLFVHEPAIWREARRFPLGSNA